MDVLQKNGRVEIPPMPEHEAIWHHFRLRLLRYWALGKPTGGESLMPTAHGSPLERLRWNSYYLAPAYGWTEAQAATFILTGAAPRQQQIRVGLRDARDFGALSRIVLTVDPTVSPKEVAEQYRIAREVAIGRDRRPRQMDDKHLRLALVALHKRSGQTWAALLQEWNERWQAKRVEWVYPDVWNFSRDCVRAHKRLLGKTVTFIRDAEEENRSDGPHFHER